MLEYPRDWGRCFGHPVRRLVLFWRVGCESECSKWISLRPFRFCTGSQRRRFDGYGFGGGTGPKRACVRRTREGRVDVTDCRPARLMGASSGFRERCMEN
jgi:hypothetical protein